MNRPSFPCHQTLLALAKSVFLCALLMSCGQEPTPVNNTDRPLLATTPPVARMVEAVMGEPVNQLIPDGTDAKEWTPSEVQLVQMSESLSDQQRTWLRSEAPKIRPAKDLMASKPRTCSRSPLCCTTWWSTNMVLKDPIHMVSWTATPGLTPKRLASNLKPFVNDW